MPISKLLHAGTGQFNMLFQVWLLSDFFHYPLFDSFFYVWNYKVFVCVCQLFKVRLVSVGVVLVFLILLVFGIISLANFLAHWKETMIRIEDHTSKFMSSFGCSSETLRPSSWEPKGAFFTFRYYTSVLLLLDCRGVKFSLWKQSSLFISVTST